MKAKAIVYTSNTGFTERYAKMAAKKTGLPLYTLDEAKGALCRGECVIYFGWLFASHLKKYKKAAKRYSVCAAVGVGLGDSGAQDGALRAADKIPESIPVFTVQGGMKREELRGLNKFMIKMLVKMLSSKNRTEDEDRMLTLISEGGDYVCEENLRAFYEWYEAQE